MAAADTARLIASLELKDRLSPGIKSANKSLGSLESRAYKVGRNIGTGIANAGKIAAVGVAALASQVALGLDSLIKLEQAEAQTAAVLKSTGQAAGQNGADITRLAEKYESLNATIGDEFIRAGENMLLTFTNIRGKAFEPALEAVLNLNTAMGKGPEGLTKTAILVGKALNDPTKGLTALTRVGVAFSKEQVKRIKALQKEGKTYQAQKIILAELNKEFGGSFLAQGGTTAGKIAKFTDSIEDLQRALAEALLPAIGNVADELSTFLQGAEVKTGIASLGREIGNLFSKERIGKGIELVKSAFRFAKEAAPVVADAAKVMSSAIKTAVSLFKSLPPEIQAIAVGGLAVQKLTGGLVTNLAGGVVDTVSQRFLARGSSPANPVWVAGTGLGGGPGGAAGGLGAFGKAVVGGAIIGGVALSLDSIQQLAKENAAAAAKGLTPAETAAMRYYTASIADQELIRKRLGEIPSKSEWLSALDKLGQTPPGTPKGVGATGAPRPAGSDTFRSDSPEKRDWRHADAVRIATEIEKMHAGIVVSLSPKPVVAAHRDSTTKQTNAIERVRSGIGTSLSNHKQATVAAAVAAKNATERVAAAARGTTRAVDRKDLSVTLAATTNVGVRFSIREQANAVSSRTVHKIL